MEIGCKINSFTFLGYATPKIRNNGGKRARGFFKCDCGLEKEYDYSKIKTGETKQCYSCGRILASENRKTHGLVNHPLYSKWNDIKNRCYNEKVDRYPNYGGRGIKVCDEWRNDFKSFYDWSIANGWKKGLSIERKEVDKNYSPENCEYITMKEQGYNKQNTFYVEIDSIKYSLAKLMNDNGLSDKYSVVWRGLKDGRTIEYYIKKLGISV